MKRTDFQQRVPVNKVVSYSGCRFPPDAISYAVWLYYRFPLSLRMVEELLAARGIDLTYETVRRWSVKLGLGIGRRIRSTALARGDKWHLDEVAVTINGKSAGCGAQWTSMVRCSTCWCKAGATSTRPNGVCENCSRSTDAHRAL